MAAQGRSQRLRAPRQEPDKDTHINEDQTAAIPPFLHKRLAYYNKEKKNQNKFVICFYPFGAGGVGRVDKGSNSNTDTAAQAVPLRTLLIPTAVRKFSFRITQNQTELYTEILGIPNLY